MNIYSTRDPGDNNTLHGAELYMFILGQKSLDIKIMFQEDI